MPTVVSQRAPEAEPRSSDGTYYGVPVIHQPHWKWLIICYFFLGGISGAAFVVATIADLVGPKGDRRIGQVGRYVSFAALLPSPVLLILDLGRPERFLNMLRVLKPHSPMSIGTWGLTAFGFFSGLAALRQAAADGVLGRGALAQTATRLPARALGLGGSPFAFFVAGYTGVLLAATAVPLWAKRALLVGPLFLASAFSTATAAIAAVLALLPGTGRGTHRRLEQLQTIAMVGELALHAAWIEGLGETAAPIERGRTGALLRHGTIGAGLVVPLCLHALETLLPARWARALSLLASALALMGGFILRYAVVVGGRESADDPRATFAWTEKRQSSRAAGATDRL